MKYIIDRVIATILLLCLLVIFTGAAVSAQTTETEKKWNFLAEPYLMFPYMNGETGIGNNLILPVEASPGDIFNKLQMGAMVFLKAQTPKWIITSDLVYMNLNQDLTPGIILHDGSVTAKQLIWEPAGLYRPMPFLAIGLGGRLNYVQTSVDGSVNTIPEGTSPISGRHHKTWFDPIIIVQLETDIHDKWLFKFRGDVGGFNVGSALTWQLQGDVGYRFTKLFQLSVGYRYISIDYSSGDAPREFVFNMGEYGPTIKFGFNF